jgi:hypothetical protein
MGAPVGAPAGAALRVEDANHPGTIGFLFIPDLDPDEGEAGDGRTEAIRDVCGATRIAAGAEISAREGLHVRSGSTSRRCRVTSRDSEATSHARSAVRSVGESLLPVNPAQLGARGAHRGLAKLVSARAKSLHQPAKSIR